MRLSVVIAAHNEGAALWKTVQSCHVECQQLEYELIVVDDASTDNSFELLGEQLFGQRVISVSERQGASPSKHLGAQAATGDVLIFLDGHCKPEVGALTRLLEAVEELHGEAIVTPTIAGLDVDRWLTSKEQVGHGYVVELERFECGWIPLEKMKAIPLRRRTYYENPALIGCSLAISRMLYEKLRGFDAGMWIWGSEDIDFGLKCWLMGHQILHLPEAVVGHRFRSSFDNYQVSGEHVAVNQLRMARKNYTDGVWNAWITCAQERLDRKSVV